MNPAREAHRHSLSLDGRTEAQDPGTVLSTHRLYGLSEGEAKQVMTEVIRAVRDWGLEADDADIAESEQRIVAAAFSALEPAAAAVAA